MAEHFEGLPKVFKYTLIFFDRVGFPIAAFLIMCWLYVRMQDQMVKAVSNNTRAIISLGEMLTEATGRPMLRLPKDDPPGDPPGDSK